VKVLRQLALLAVFAVAAVFGQAGRDVDYVVFFNPNSELLDVYVNIRIVSPRDVGFIYEDEEYLFNFDVEVSFKNKEVHKDTILNYKYKLYNSDIEFYSNFFIELPPGKYGVDISIHDYLNGRDSYKSAEINVVQPVDAATLVGASIGLFKGVEDMTLPAFGYIGLEATHIQVIVYLYNYNFHAKTFYIYLYNNEMPFFVDSITVNPNSTFGRKYNVLLSDLSYGTVKAVVKCGNYQKEGKITYVYDEIIAQRVVEALKLVTNEKTWKKYFKGYKEYDVVLRLLNFTKAMQLKDPNFEYKFNEFLFRFNYAENLFVESLTRGYQTDRGRMLIIWGMPDDIELVNALEYRVYKDYQLWHYYKERFTIVFERLSVTDEWLFRGYIGSPTDYGRKLWFDESQ